jgi:hypothetical protein
MSKNTNRGAFFAAACLAMAALAAGRANAQQGPTLPAEGPKPAPVEFADILEQRAEYTPHSGIYKATMGTIASNVDLFMSPLDFGAVNMQNWFSYAGVDENGINIGYAAKLGAVYLGISYGGSLIDEILGRITNQDILSLQKRDEIKKESGGTSAKPGLVDSKGNAIEGITTNENTVDFVFGAGIFGLKLGFAAYLQGREIGSAAQEYRLNYEHAFESSLKPSLELGWNFPVGSVRTKIALRGAYDTHQYISKTGETFYYTKEDSNGNVSINSSFVEKEVYQDFTEPSGGFTLGFEFGMGNNARAEVDFTGDMAYRIYRSNEQDGITAAWKITDTTPHSPEVPKNTEAAAPEIFDLRTLWNPVFAVRTDVSERIAVGARASLSVGYDVFTISQSLYDINLTNPANPVLQSTAEIDYSRLSVIPELGAGVLFMLWPDHFSLHAGLGIDLFSYHETTSTRSIGGIETTNTLKILELPATRITAGLTLNLTTDMALDLLAITSGPDINTTKLTILLTLNK